MAIACPAHALKGHPYGGGIQAEISQIVGSDNNLQTTKATMAAYGQKLEKIRLEVVGPRDITKINDSTPSLLVSKARREGFTGKKLIKEVTKNKITELIDLSIEKFKAAQAANTKDEVIKFIGDSLILIHAVRMDGMPIIPVYALKLAKSYLGEWEFRKNVEANEEASNLVDAITGQYLDISDIQKSKEKNIDLSKLNPPKDSMFWHSPGDIKNLDIQEVALGKTHPLYDGADFDFPKDNNFEFNFVIKSSTKPKIAVFHKDKNGKKIKYKLKIGFEMHAEPTAATLLMAAGYPADLTQYRRSVRVNLGKSKYAEMVTQWESYYNRDYPHRKSKIEEFIETRGTDEKGEDYVVFKEGIIEPRVEGVRKVGPWAYADQTYAREVRGLVLHQIWLANLDLKEMDNNDLAIREMPNGEKKVYQMISDAGSSFGNFGAFFLEKPELFPDNIIKKNTKNGVELNYYASQAPSIREHLTYSDGRWATRLLAQLTRAQIAKAVEIGGWPQCIQAALTEKLIRRRNSLVEAFDLKNEFDIYKTNDAIDANKVSQCVASKQVKNDFITDFDFDMDTIVAPARNILWTSILDAARNSLGNLEKINISGSEFGFQKGVVSYVIFNTRREIEENPNSTHFEEKFLVKDSLMVGFRLGVAYGVLADSEVHREFTLVYPARSRAEARKKNGFITNILLPRDIYRSDMPKKYVLKTEHFLNFRKGLKVDSYNSFSSLGVDFGSTRTRLWQSILDVKNPDKPLLMRERSHEMGRFINTYLRLGLLKIPLINTAKNWGDSLGYGYELSTLKMQDKEYSSALHKAFVNGKFEDFDKQQQAFQFNNVYSVNKFDLGLMFIINRKRYVQDNILIVDNKGNEKMQNQVHDTQRIGWSLGFTSEYRERKMHVYSETSPNTLPKYSIESTFVMEDMNTKTKELEEVYLKNLNMASRDSQPLIQFTPSLGYSRNGIWGHTISYVNLRIYHEGLLKLLGLTDKEFWQKLSLKLGKSRDQIDNDLSTYNFAKSEFTSNPRTAYGRRDELTSDEMRFYSAVLSFIKNLNIAKKTTLEGERVMALAEILKSSFYKEPKNGFNSSLASFLLFLIDKDDYFLEVGVTAPPGKEVKFIDETALWGAEGTKKPLDSRYLIHAVESPSDIFFMLDAWF
jgi:hypothetical protein